VVKASLSTTCEFRFEGSISDLPWHADNKKAEPELSPQDKKGQRTAIITGFISVAFGVSVNSYSTTRPAGAICCSTVQWSSCGTYCRRISQPCPCLCCTVPCLLYHSMNINNASYYGITAGRLHSTEDLLQAA